jgi:23S rRNA (adenine2503-C2)-methyltransferase
VKLLLELSDGERVETVNMPGSSGPTLCVSTQVGCVVGCLFCASGLAGLRRNLTSGEILEQFVRGNAVRPIRRAVVMGIGEPSMNLESTLRALDAVHAPDGLDLGVRKITISTIGFPAKIARLAEHPHRYQLAVSLHSADQELRDHLVPLARTVKLEELHAALRAYFERTGREITLEYVLLRGVNDSAAQAQDLARWMKGLRATVNLIPFNPVDEAPFRRPRREDVDAFASALERAGVTATVRWSKGVEGDAACGQLRVRAEKRATAAPGTEKESC